MKTKTLLISLLLTLGASLAAPTWADGVIRVVGVQTDNLDAYVAQIERGRAILESLNSPGQIRVLVASYAGPNAGNVVVTVEYANMVELAQDEAAGMASAEYRAWIAGLDEIRTIVSDSIYRDITP